jgi:hypothetical protein
MAKIKKPFNISLEKDAHFTELHSHLSTPCIWFDMKI